MMEIDLPCDLVQFVRKNLSFYWEESKQGKQDFVLSPQDQEVAVCEPAVQEDLVGSREALSEAALVNQSNQDHREKWTGSCCQEGRDRSSQVLISVGSLYSFVRHD